MILKPWHDPRLRLARVREVRLELGLKRGGSVTRDSVKGPLLEPCLPSRGGSKA